MWNLLLPFHLFTTTQLSRLWYASYDHLATMNVLLKYILITLYMTYHPLVPPHIVLSPPSHVRSIITVSFGPVLLDSHTPDKTKWKFRYISRLWPTVARLRRRRWWWWYKNINAHSRGVISCLKSMDGGGSAKRQSAHVFANIWLAIYTEDDTHGETLLSMEAAVVATKACADTHNQSNRV